jgi:hypothetical protein
MSLPASLLQARIKMQWRRPELFGNFCLATKRAFDYCSLLLDGAEAAPHSDRYRHFRGRIPFEQLAPYCGPCASILIAVSSQVRV